MRITEKVITNWNLRKFEKAWESLRKENIFWKNENVWSADLKMVEHAKIWG